METAEDLARRLVPTPFVSSWLGRSRPADPFDPDSSRRASAWAHWALTSFRPMTGNSDRPYVALTLPGKFYDPRGTGPSVRPHLEIPSAQFERAQVDFPDRLAQMGNALMFPWWIVPEVMAVKRALFHNARGPIDAATDLLNDRRPALVDAFGPLAAAAGRRWTVVENLQVEDPHRLSELATAPFESAEVAAYLPAAADLEIRVEFDEKLREANRAAAGRRVGVWRIAGVHDGHKFSFGVLTPRLTRSSTFTDPLFDPRKESPAALLVRGLILRRLLRTQLGADVSTQVGEAEHEKRNGGGPRLRAIVARVGEKLPEASVSSAVHFLQTYPNSTDAWATLTAWAGHRGPASEAVSTVLTVSEDGYKAAHQAALRAVRRAEEPVRDDINVILPLAWDSRGRVVRVTFSRPAVEEPTS